MPTTTSTKQRVTHQIEVAADPEIVYAVIADAASWPQYFKPTIHVVQTPLDAGSERLQIWATANEEVRSWTSRRTLDPRARVIEFRQEITSDPVAAMSGTWRIEPTAEGGSVLHLDHEYAAVDDDPEKLAWIARATDRNSHTELANIKTVAENWAEMDELVFAFEDSVTIAGDLVAAYDFLYDAGQWPSRLPHVGRLDLTETVPNVQWMAMETVTKDGSSHVTESVRICQPEQRRIFYKQLVTPSMMLAHTGEWSFEQTPDGVLATSRHTVTLNKPAITSVLGESGTVESAKEFIRNAAGGNSLATLTLAKKFVEGS